MNEADLSNEKKRMAMEERIPLGRLGVPEDLVGPALFLASSMSQYVVSLHLHYLPQRIGRSDNANLSRLAPNCSLTGVVSPICSKVTFMDKF